jgi:hypothetical protein
VLDHLGDPGHPLTVLENRSRARPRGMLSVADLTACLEGRAASDEARR